ncbi:hypothetical protein CON65_02425 [Bacillus pseudomycoides]|uniref:Uncharacterized protein n=1 Tax=Bacillus pseudomycoides TaxID=64104 RepID=A0AA91ZV31_9BACI|nr:MULTISPECIES: hypothetical protein [Bacillus]PED84310.1 hypothetical protein CON65_02425 [Bacillus pseudomycoides]PEU15837.1 hypothetical protein CN524_06130 [Bacillus sp. AFS019443]PEU19727.1 hypothetical protein CN525_06150 [Bacillus sp. AFS014408]PFW64863.1 hypothetical protein COL20_02430 [Bacillus sp. AFS075034]
MKVLIVCGGTLGEAFDILRKAFINMGKQFEELNEMIKSCSMYEEEVEYKKRISFPRMTVNVMKSQVMDRKPKCIRARTVC